MAMGKRKGARQSSLWIETRELASSPGHPFYTRLNALFDERGFDDFVEGLCEPFYADGVGRPSIPPGVYFRMLLAGYFEGLTSERGIAWRLADSLSLRQFCGFELTESTPNHSTLSRTRQLLDEEVYRAVFRWVLEALQDAGLLRGKSLGIDATMLEANAAMRSIVRRDSGEGYDDYLKSLAKAAGEPEGTRRERARKDRSRKKKGSNRDWKHPHDPDAKITRMKDGRTRLGHKAEHAVDLDSGAVVAVTVQPADRGDTTTQEETLEEAARNLGDLSPEESESSESQMQEVVADRGYHSNAVLDRCRKLKIRSYIAEPKRPRRRWKGRRDLQQAVYNNRRRIRGDRGRALLRQRAEKVERSFAHCYETGGLRRLYVRGHEPVRKRLLVHVAAFNLGLLLRRVLGAGTPRGLRALAGQLLDAPATLLRLLRAPGSLWDRLPSFWPQFLADRALLNRPARICA
jgi:transposase